MKTRARAIIQGCLLICEIVWSVSAADAQATREKVLVATFLFAEDSASPTQVGKPLVGYAPATTTGPPSKQPPAEKEVIFELRDAADRVLREYRIWHPRFMVGHKGVEEVPKATFSAKLPFDERAAFVTAREFGKDTGKIDVRDVIATFCSKNLADRECELWLKFHSQ